MMTEVLTTKWAARGSYVLCLPGVFTLDEGIHGKCSLITLLDSEDRIREHQSPVFPEVVTIFAIADIHEIMIFKFPVTQRDNYANFLHP